MRKPKQFTFEKVKGWGGKRKGAGRPRSSNEISHVKRAEVKLQHPLHVTIKLKRLPMSLRSKAMLEAFKRAANLAKKRGVHICQFSLLSNHLHLIVEVSDNAALTKGMRSFGGSFAKAIRKHAGGAGAVFAGRFHMHVLKTPTEYRRALEYVLLNQAKHQRGPARIDGYSSAIFFDAWELLLKRKPTGWERIQESWLPMARSWLARTGWVRGRAYA